jgi:hypothetical protein
MKGNAEDTVNHPHTLIELLRAPRRADERRHRGCNRRLEISQIARVMKIASPGAKRCSGLHVGRSLRILCPTRSHV